MKSVILFKTASLKLTLIPVGIQRYERKEKLESLYCWVQTSDSWIFHLEPCHSYPQTKPYQPLVVSYLSCVTVGSWETGTTTAKGIMGREKREKIIFFILIQSPLRAEIWALQLVLVSSKGRVTKFGRKTRWRTKTRQLRLLSCKTHRFIAMTLTRTWENGRYYWKKWYIIIIRWIWGSQSFAMSVHRRKFVETMQKCSHL